MSMSDNIDWNDAAFSTGDYQDPMVAESPFTSAFNDFTNFDNYDSPAVYGLRTPSKSGPDAAAAGATANFSNTQQGPPGTASTPAESSSQDSASDSSGGRKRKTASESPISDPVTDSGMQGMHMQMPKEDITMTANNYHNPPAYDQTFNQPMGNLAVDSNMVGNDDIFNFNSTASSPNLNLPRAFDHHMSLESKMNVPPAVSAAQYARNSPVTINPGMFTLGGASRDQSPVTNPMMLNTASPGIFSTPSSDSNDTYNINQNWNTVQNPTWPPGDFNAQYNSDGGMSFTPSPIGNGGTAATTTNTLVQRGRSKLHIAPIAAKSRVETQINIIMTLETPPPNLEHLHLPLQTIAKSKLLAKEDVDKMRSLELYTMLVCTSAMQNPALKEKAMKRAAVQNNDDIQRRAESQRQTSDDEKNNMKDVPEEDKPANGGEVRICHNCIQRERKRAGRKKLKREEEQQHWERYETERVVVFNSNEYLPFKPFEPSQQPSRDSGMTSDDTYRPPEGAVSVAAAMRIACYCRHQSEKEGFQVIFTMKDQQGNVVAQEISDSILITDDHKTHPPTLTPMTSDLMYGHAMQFPPNGLPTSYSMVDMSSHAQQFTTSKSHGNLQSLGYQNQSQFNPQSHVHQMQMNTGFQSGTTSATMTPTSLSRPASPNSAGNAGPNKKRKSSTFHRRVPSALQMTRVDTSQPPSLSAQHSAAMSANFSPNGPGYGQQPDQSFMTIPQNNGPAQYYGSGPPTPANEQGAFSFGQPHQLDIARAQNAAAYFSHPSSAVPSRSNSPVLQPRQFARNAVQNPTNHARGISQLYNGQPVQAPQPAPAPPVHEERLTPSITKVTPTEGPSVGGTEVSIFGYNFSQGTQIWFGNVTATTTYYGPQCMLVVTPPGATGPVQIRLTNAAGNVQYNTPQASNSVFTYTDNNTRKMEMALRFLSQQQTGDPSRWMQITNDLANQFVQTAITPAGIPNHQGFEGGR